MGEEKMPETGQEKNSSILTHIDVLDKLLGLEGGKIGIKEGGIILIRGEPGSGKTTLGLQIMSQTLKKLHEEEEKKKNEDIEGQKGKKAKVIFYSLESDPAELLGYVNKKYSFFASDDLRRIDALSVSDIEAAILKETEIINGITAELDKFVKLPPNTSGLGLAIAGIRGIKSFLSHTIYTRDLAEDERIDAEDHCPIVFVDSLSVLLQLLQKHWKYKDISERLLLNTICDCFRKHYAKSIIIFTSEYHFKDVTKKSAVSESFFCDIEISLFSEPIVIPTNYESQYESPLGSNTLSILNPNEVKSIQTQSFCRVLKSRQSPNQTRRCAYDIVSGKGIEFFETHPGDGHLKLFSENRCQEEIWKILFDQSLPQLYPALRYDSFDRGSMQRVSAAQRRFRYVPQRTDVYLSSFDNYWINWYSEMCLKANIADILKQELGVDDLYLRSDEKRLELLNNIHSALSKTKNQVYFGRKIRKVTQSFFEELCTIYQLSEKTRESFGAKDTFNNFLSGLLNKFSRAELMKDRQNKALDMNRPCLRCLWYRSLLKKLYKEVGRKDETGFLKLCSDGLKKSGLQTGIASYEHKLGKLIEDVISTCSDSQAKDCKNKLKERCFAGGSSFEKFLDDKKDACKCKRIAAKYIAGFPRPFPMWLIRQDGGIGIIRQLIDSLSGNIIDALKNTVFEDIFTDEPTEDDSKTKLDTDNKSYNLIEDGLKCFSDKIEGCTDGDKRKNWVVILSRLFFDVMERPPRYRLISPIRGDKLRLYGEKRSEIIDEMESHHPDTRRPVHRPWHLFSLRDQNAYSSVPYDANIGFIVYRKDILKHFYKELVGKDGKAKKDYTDIIVGIVEAQEAALKKYFRQSAKNGSKENNGGTKAELQEKHDNLVKGVGELVATSVKTKQYLPQTWEEIIAYHLLKQDKKQQLKKEKKQPQSAKEPDYDFLIETRTPDSYLCTMLEFIWSCGANLRIFPDYSIDQRQKTLEGLMRAFYLMGLMFQDGIIPKNSTLEVNEFSKIYGRPDENNEKNQTNKQKPDKNRKDDQPDWVFARHWYSTLVDILSAPKKKDNNQPITAEADFLWQLDAGKKMKLGIMPIPVSFSNYAQYGKDVWHISCWGDWHLAMLSGSENVELGADLINELMASDRIYERAFANASVPTVQAFYDKHGGDLCFNMPVRKNIKPPDWTYDTLRGTLFKHAKSRSQIFDYHHCIAEFHSVMEYIHLQSLQVTAKGEHRKVLNKDTCDDIYTKLDEALKNIEEFKTKPFLMA